MPSVSFAPEPWVITSLSHFCNSFFGGVGVGSGGACPSSETPGCFPRTALWKTLLWGLTGWSDVCFLPSALGNLQSKLDTGLFCELRSVWNTLGEARKSQSLFCSEIPALTGDFWCGLNCGPHVSVQREGSLPSESSGPLAHEPLRLLALPQVVPILPFGCPVPC